MARADMSVQNGYYHLIRNADVQDRTSSALTRVQYSGEPVKLSGTGSQYVIPVLNGDPEIGSDWFVGINQNDSDETTAANGTVEVKAAIPGVTMMEGKGTTNTTVDTAAEITDLHFDTVTFDVSSLVYTVDAAEGHDDNVHGLLILGGNPTEKTVWFVAKTEASIFGSNVA